MKKIEILKETCQETIMYYKLKNEIIQLIRLLLDNNKCLDLSNDVINYIYGNKIIKPSKLGSEQFKELLSHALNPQRCIRIWSKYTPRCIRISSNYEDYWDYWDTL